MGWVADNFAPTLQKKRMVRATLLSQMGQIAFQPMCTTSGNIPYFMVILADVSFCKLEDPTRLRHDQAFSGCNGSFRLNRIILTIEQPMTCKSLFLPVIRHEPSLYCRNSKPASDPMGPSPISRG